MQTILLRTGTRTSHHPQGSELRRRQRAQSQHRTQSVRGAPPRRCCARGSRARARASRRRSHTANFGQGGERSAHGAQARRERHAGWRSSAKAYSRQSGARWASPRSGAGAHQRRPSVQSACGINLARAAGAHLARGPASARAGRTLVSPVSPRECVSRAASSKLKPSAGCQGRATRIPWRASKPEVTGL